MLMGCALLAPVSSCLQLTTEVCLIPNISVKKKKASPAIESLLKERGMIGWNGGRQWRGNLLDTSRRTGATLNEIEWREDEVQHTVKIDFRLQSRENTWQIVNTKKVRKRKRQTSSPSFTTYTPQTPELLRPIQGSTDMFNP